MQISETSSVGKSLDTQSGSAARNPEMEKAAKAFEAIFLRQMIGAMRSSSLADGMFDSSATQQFRDMADARTAEQMAGTGKFGIAELLIQQFGAKADAAAPSMSLKPDIRITPKQDDTL